MLAQTYQLVITEDYEMKGPVTIPMQLLELITIILLLIILAAAIVILIVRRQLLVGKGNDHFASEIDALREDKSEAQRLLAVEMERSCRLPELENQLSNLAHRFDELRDDKATVDSHLATAKEGLTRVESQLEETRARLGSVEEQRVSEVHLREALGHEKGKLEEALAVKGEALSRVEQLGEELRTRLSAAENTRDSLNAKIQTALRERAELESASVEKSAQMAEKNRAISAIQAELVHTKADLEASRTEASDLRPKLAALDTRLTQERLQAAERVGFLEETKARLMQDLRLVADEVMQRYFESAGRNNKEQIDALLLPLRERLSDFQAGLQTAHGESVRERASLAEQIRHLSESSAKMTAETHNLTQALKGKSQTQGAWGEMILGSVLEHSGLREGIEYRRQHNQTTDEGQRQRLDVIVNLPGGQCIVIDAKVSLIAFEAYVNADSDLEREACLARHLSSLRTHIRLLSGKEYQSSTDGSLDYVVLFIPIEGALAAALSREPELTSFAVENNVAMATPTTLMMALRTVANVWQVERRNQNAEAVAERAGHLYDKFVGFVSDLKIVGSRLSQARDSYDDAMGKLSTGRGNLIRQVEQLRELGAKTVKVLPAGLLDEGDAEIGSDEEGSGESPNP